MVNVSVARALYMVAAVSASGSGVALAQPSFSGLGHLNPDRPYGEAWGVARQSRAAVGLCQVAGSGFAPIHAAIRKEMDAPLTAIYDESGNGGSAVSYAASDNGLTVVGTVDFGFFSTLGTQAFVWTAGAGAVMIGDLPGGVSGVPRSSARAVSADGMIVAGMGESDAGNEAFIYSRTTAIMTGLGDLPGGAFASSAAGISADGAVVVGSGSSGQGETQAFRWTAQTGIAGLGFMPTPPGTVRYSAAEAISADGRVIVGEGRSMNAVNGGEAFRWTSEGGFEPLGDLPGGGFQSWAYAVSADGSVVVGRASIEGPCGPFGCGSSGRPFIWDRQHGMRNLRDVLVNDLGLNLTGWSLQDARGISADGLTIVGNGMNPDGHFEGWTATIGTPAPPCAADFDHSGAVNSADFFAFLNEFFAGSAGADFNHSGAVDSQDFFDFLGAFFMGCP